MPTTADLLTLARSLTDAWADLEPDDLDRELAAFADTSDDKIKALRAVFVTATAQAEIYTAEAAALLAVATAHKRTADRVKASTRALLLARKELNMDTKIPGVVSLVGNGGALPLIIADPKAVPYEYTRTITEPDPALLRAALDTGAVIPGVSYGERGVSARWAK